jgi:hypothetical protein
VGPAPAEPEPEDPLVTTAELARASSCCHTHHNSTNSNLDTQKTVNNSKFPSLFLWGVSIGRIWAEKAPDGKMKPNQKRIVALEFSLYVSSEIARAEPQQTYFL